MSVDGVVATVNAGAIVSLVSVSANQGFRQALETLFEDDPRYTKIHELGLGLNPIVAFYPGNFLPNEMRQGVHFGLGLTPFTRFHIDLVCDQILVTAETNER